MKEPKQGYKILWEKTPLEGAKILRILSGLPIADLPDHITGYPVTELGNYCFAPECKLPNTYKTFYSDVSKKTVTELCGNYLQSVHLPDTLEIIGDYAFYNCRNLSDISCSSRLHSIGSDAFMNCHNLHQIFFRCTPTEKSCLRQILTQISWDTEVFFIGNSSLDNSSKQAVLLYPEYYEAYDEIAPAHIFGRKIVGEGFRARQCFKNDIIDFSQYDKTFSKACVEESESTLCRFAYHRLRYPYQLSDECKTQYTNYIRTHDKILCQQFIKHKKFNDLKFLFQEKLLSPQTSQSALTLAAQSGWSEGCAGILRWKQQQKQISQLTKYKFEDFNE